MQDGEANSLERSRSNGTSASVPGLLVESDDREEQPWKLHIVFHSPDALYNEGQEVTGEVVAALTQDIVIEKLTLSFSGLAQVTWPSSWRGDASKKNRQQQPIVEEESYLNQNLVLYSLEDARKGSKEDAPMVVLAGRHTYPFSVQLPYNIPSSFTGDKADLKYTARAVLERPFQSEITASRNFDVISVLDLNGLPQVAESTICEAKRTVGVMCCTTGNIKAIWRLDSIGYVPGETMKIQAEVVNHSRLRVRKCKAVLIQHARVYNKKGDSHHERRVVATQQHGEVGKGRASTWLIKIAIPPLPPTGLKNCSIIDLWYTLKLSAQPQGPADKLQKTTDIIIGTIPRGEHAQTVFTGFAPSMTTTGGSEQSRRPEAEALDLSYFI